MRKLILIVALWCSSCIASPPNLTPQAQQAFYATQGIHLMDVVRDFANSASKTTPPLIDKASLLIVVNWHEATVTAMHASPGGWKAIAVTALGQVNTLMPADRYAVVKPYVDAARVGIQELP